MIRDITLGQFIPGDTVIHRLDPRTKIVLTVAYLVGVFAVTRWVGFVLTAAFVAVCAGLAQGLFNFGLNATGYVPPFAADSIGALKELLSDGGYTAQVALDTLQASKDGIFTVGVVQNPAVQKYFVWGYQGIYAIVMIVLMVLFWFYDVEKHLPQIQKDIVARHKAEAAAQGIAYVSPEEQAAREQAEQDRIAEENRVRELKARCEKKGLRFEEEEAKYQAKLAEKKAKAEARAAKKAKK